MWNEWPCAWAFVQTSSHVPVLGLSASLPHLERAFSHAPEHVASGAGALVDVHASSKRDNVNRSTEMRVFMTWAERIRMP